MNKKTLIIPILLLVLTACTLGGGQGERYTGTDGVDISLVSSQPPQTVYDNTEFPISVRVTNNGVHDITDEDNPVIISSNLASAYHIEPLTEGALDKREVILEGRRRADRGERTTLLLGQFRTANVDRTLQRGSEEVIIDACYPYKTIFTGTICAENSFSLTDTSICTPREVYRYRSQGAPVAVTEVKPLLTPTGTNVDGVTEFTPEYVITIQNRGDGTPSVSGENKCDSPETQNAVELSATLDGRSLDCGEGKIELSRGQGDITCTLEGDTPALRSNYQALLDAEVEYDYTTSTSKTLRVQARQR